ncbi:MAG: hypothetical protein ACOX0O_08150 [Candidatus Methanoculleus thermohydrogenotrophicum]
MGKTHLAITLGYEAVKKGFRQAGTEFPVLS